MGGGGGGEPLREVGNIVGIGIGTERAHARRGAVGVGGRNHHAGGRDAGALGGIPFGGIDQLAGHHASVDHGNGDTEMPVVEHEGAGMQGGLHGVGGVVEESTVYDDRKLDRADINRCGPRAEFGGGGRGQETEKQKECEDAAQQ